MNNKKDIITRTLEIIPGAFSWGILGVVFLLAFLKPIVCAVVIISFDFYWIVRTMYLTILLLIARRAISKYKNKDWLTECRTAFACRGLDKIYHLVIFPIYKEGPEILRASLAAIKKANYLKDRIIVVVSFEERNPIAHQTAKILEQEFGNEFLVYLTVYHPSGLAGETNTKGANATWAAKRGKEVIEGKKIPYEDVIISCFDADTCIGKEYFSCLSYNFLTTPKPHQASYQPIPVYNNNVWYAPSFARLVEISSSFTQMIESMRIEKFVTFSSHSMSFKTLIDINYWPVNMISDDSVIYWKAYLFYKGDYKVVPLHVTVSMDMAYSSNLFKTIIMQYKQKRRWAWGVENFPYVVSRFLIDRHIPFTKKIRRSYHLLENHVTWAIWVGMITIVPSLPILFGGIRFNQVPIGYNLPRIAGNLFNITIATSLAWILLSRTILPPRPPDVKWSKNIIMTLEWVLVPLILIIVGSTPALDAQTRLMLGKYMEFVPTEKHRNKQK